MRETVVSVLWWELWLEMAAKLQPAAAAGRRGGRGRDGEVVEVEGKKNIALYAGSLCA